MDRFSVITRINNIQLLTSDIITFLHDAKDVSKDRTQCEIEILNISDLLSTLNYHVHDQPYSNEAWHLQVKALADGPMDQYMSALQKLRSKLTWKFSTRSVFRSGLIWKSVEEDISHILSKVKRLKSLIQVAHEIDHL